MQNTKGKLFSFELKDFTGEFRCTAFNDAVRFFNLIEVDNVIILSQAKIQRANKQYNPNSDNELIIRSDSIVQAIENNNDCPQATLEPCAISNIEFASSGAVVDVMGICLSASELDTVNSSKTGRLLKKRDLILMDKSAMIQLTIWGKEAEDFVFEAGQVIVVRKAKVSEFKGRSLSVGPFPILQDPHLETAYSLKGWFFNSGQYENAPRNLSDLALSTNLDNLSLIEEINEENVSSGQNFFTINGTITHRGMLPYIDFWLRF